MQTCEPIMVLAEDIEVVDAIIKSRHNGKEKDIFSREMRNGKPLSMRFSLTGRKKSLENLAKTLDVVCTLCYNNNVKRTQQGESPRSRKERSVTAHDKKSSLYQR